MEKSQCCPHPQKGKQILNNYRPVSLLPICGKLFEKNIFDAIFQYLMEKNLLNQPSCLAILAYISLFQSHMKYMTLLMPIPH